MAGGKLTLGEDFRMWWGMPRYTTMSIPARQMADMEVTVRHGSNSGWPGPEKNVKYWVELENGWAVGIIVPTRDTELRETATFPFYPLEQI
jgi:hypothetical protein